MSSPITDPKPFACCMLCSKMYNMQSRDGTLFVPREGRHVSEWCTMPNCKGYGPLTVKTKGDKDGWLIAVYYDIIFCRQVKRIPKGTWVVTDHREGLENKPYANRFEGTINSGFSMGIETTKTEDPNTPNSYSITQSLQMHYREPMRNTPTEPRRTIRRSKTPTRFNPC